MSIWSYHLVLWKHLNWAELPSTNYSNPGSLGFGQNKMTGGDISAEVLSLVHLLEYNNTVNNNFVNNVLPTLKGGASRFKTTIDWELTHFITNSQNNEKLFNTITKLLTKAQSEALKVYLRKLRIVLTQLEHKV